MAINKKGLVIVPDTINTIILKIINGFGKEITTNDIMQSLAFHGKKMPRPYVNDRLAKLTKANKIIRVKKGNGVFNPAIYKAKPHE